MLETSIGQKPNSPYSNSAMMISILKWVSTTRLSAFYHLEGRGGFFFLLALWEKMTTREQRRLPLTLHRQLSLGSNDKQFRKCAVVPWFRCRGPPRTPGTFRKCTARQRKTQRLSLNVSSAHNPFLHCSHSGRQPSPILSGWLSTITLSLQRQ